MRLFFFEACGMKALLLCTTLMCALADRGERFTATQAAWASSALKDAFPTWDVQYINGVDNSSTTVNSCGVLLALDLQDGTRSLGPQAFSRRCAQAEPYGCTLCVIHAIDGPGLQYGALDLIDAVHALSSSNKDASAAVPLLPNKDAAPFILHRGLKLNAPLDARTPSYDDCSDNAQANMATMWDPNFWPEYFDALVHMRFNALSIWNPHPFPTIVSVPGYPETGYEDVMRADIDWRAFNVECDPSNGNIGTAAVVRDNLKVVASMSLRDKTAFWQNVTALGASLGIDVQFVTWSVFTMYAGGGMAGEATNETADYSRAAIRAFMQALPSVTAFGLTAGENMTRLTDSQKEAWLWRSAGLAMNDVLAADPSRRLTLIHRVWETELAPIEAMFAGLNANITLDFAFKYCGARCYTTPYPQLWAQANLTLPAGSAARFWWNLRQDDVFNMRWANVTFIRELLTHLPDANVTRGYWLGSDGWVWGREFTSLRPSAPHRQLEVSKHWLAHTAFGLLGYDPSTPDAIFEGMAAQHYPEAPSGAFMLQLSDSASHVIPVINQFMWFEWDYQWNAETCSKSGGAAAKNDSSFFSVLDFAAHAPLPGSGMISIADFVRRNATNGTTPLQVADALDAAANTTLSGVGQVSSGTNTELHETLGDYTALAWLARYYAGKIRAAVEVARYAFDGQPSHKQAAVSLLTQCSAAWRAYAGALYSQYTPVTVFARTGLADLSLLQVAVDNDVAIAGAMSADVV